MKGVDLYRAPFASSHLPKDTELSLLKAIRQSPEDDLPRLVYADWLEEQDSSDPRVKLIRFTIAAPRTAVNKFDRRSKAFRVIKSALREIYDIRKGEVTLTEVGNGEVLVAFPRGSGWSPVVYRGGVMVRHG